MRKSRQIPWVVLFLAPNLVGFLCFTFFPVIISFVGSFTTWSLKPGAKLEFIGLQNYVFLFSDPDFYFYFYNTLYLMLGLPFSIAGSLFLAVLLHRGGQLAGQKRAYTMGLACALVTFMGVLFTILLGSPNLALFLAAIGLLSSLGVAFGPVSYRTTLYLPYFTSGAATIILWTSLYNPDQGLINMGIERLNQLAGLNLPLPGWLVSTKSLLGFIPLPESFNSSGFGIGAREAILFMGFWGSVGGNNMILYLAGLSTIPTDLYEAAEMDGAGRWSQFRHVTLPSLAPTTFFIVIMSVIGGLQGGFEQARIMTGGGPAGSTTTLSYYIYIQGFERLDLGYGSAVSWVMFILIFVLTMANWRFGKGED